MDLPAPEFRSGELEHSADPFSRWLPARRERAEPRLILAPMDGVTEHVHRELITRLNATPWTAAEPSSAVDLCVSEFVRVTDHPVPASVLWRHCPELHTGGITSTGVPVFVQLLGSDLEAMAATARRAAQLGAPGIDLNFGCPAKTVNRHDGGATLLRSPCRVEQVTAAVRAAVPVTCPITVKIRIGWDSNEHVEDLARAAEQGGAAWLTIHGRTRTQGYRPPVDWPAIGRAAHAVSIPVVANGDLYAPDDVERCHNETGCGAYMVGRGVMAAPNWFRWVRGLDAEQLDRVALLRAWMAYVDGLRRDGALPRSILCRLKQWLRMAAEQREDVEALFEAVKRERELDVVMGRLDALATHPGPGVTSRRTRTS